MADNRFAAFVRDKFGSMQDLSPQPCIYKAPNHIRDVNEECYRPYVVSIGPLYYGLPSLEAMQDCKLRYLKFFLEHGINSYRLDLEHYLRIIAEMEGRVRHCYTERSTLLSDEFNGMILLDSAFIICHFMRYHPILSSSMAGIVRHIRKRSLLVWGAKLTRDLFLLENQVPFFVLERLFREAFGAAHPDTSFRDVAFGYIVNAGIPVVQTYQISAEKTEMIKTPRKIAHLVDLLRIFCFPSTLRLQAVEATIYANVRCPSVSNLRAAGVKFVKSENKNLLDITFFKGVLEIPPIRLYDVTESYYRSMILFEQSHLPIYQSSYIVDYLDYLVLLEKLIKIPEDVRILVQCGIIHNWMGNEDAVARHFMALPNT